MKKFALLFALVLVIGMLAGCSDGAPTTTEAPSGQTSTQPATTAPALPEGDYAPEGITLLSCRYTQEVTGQDLEGTVEVFANRSNQVYVDMVFYVSPTFFENNPIFPHFAAHVIYDDYTYDLQFKAESLNNVAFSGSGVPKKGGYLHMIASLPDEAMEEVKQVQYSIGSQQYTCPIAPLAQVGVLDNKTELSVGFQDSVYDGKVDFEVIDIRFQSYLLATKGGSNDHYNAPSGKMYVDVILKVTNNFASEELDGIYGYIIDGNTKTRTNLQVESIDHSRLEHLIVIAPGQELYVHMIATVEADCKEVGMRINFGGKLYYCTIANNN